MRKRFAERIRGVATLDHPVTRAAYRLLAKHGDVSRDDAADHLDVPRSVAAFHLDKLVDAGLADVRFERLTGRTGPGAGRPAKVYRRSDTEIDVSVPERHYDLAGQLLATAVERAAAEGVPVDHALSQAARKTGRSLAREGDGAAVADVAAGREAAVLAILERNGYEPRLEHGEIVLANCPFHALADAHRTLVCGMNLELLCGIIEGMDDDGRLSARLAPEPGYCCVRMSVG